MSLDKHLDDFRELTKRHPTPWKATRTALLDAAGRVMMWWDYPRPISDASASDRRAICAAINAVARLVADLGVGSLPPDSTEGGDR